MFLMPVFMVGAFALCIEYFPVAGFRSFIEHEFGGIIKRILELLYNATYGFAAVYLVVALSYYESQKKQIHRDFRVFAVISSVACYFGFMGPDVFNRKADILNYTRMTNIFSALLIGYGFTHLFFRLYNAFNKKHTRDCATAFERSVLAIKPFICCLTVSVTAGLLVSFIPNISNFNDLVIMLLNKPYEEMGASFLSGFLIMLVISVLWLFGIHGSNVFDSLLSAATGPFAIGNGQILTKPFIDTFVLMGGCGTSISLLTALLIFGKSRKNRNLGRLSLVPVLFNINETLIFGLPIVLNPIYAIPFIATPLISYIISYSAVAVGLVPAVANNVHWTVPPIISGYQATGSVAGSILQIVILLVGVAVYAPFVCLAERTDRRNESRNIRRLTKICKDCESQRKEFSVFGEDALLKTSEDDIAAKLYSDIQNQKIILHYQPLVKNNKITAAEALLRFSMSESDFDRDAEYMYPPLVTGIAYNYGLFDSLSKAVVKRALDDLESIQANGNTDFRITVNLSLGFLMNPSLRAWVISELKRHSVKPYTFGVEINENANLSDTEDATACFEELKQAEIEVLMDDFSMGNTSITILQKNYFNYVKIDGNLIKHLDNERSKSIVSSVVQLGRQLNFSVIAEYVETESQRDMLLQMGCNVFQGYLYYRAVPCSQLKALLSAQHTA